MPGFEKNKQQKTQTYIIVQPEPEIYLLLVGSRAGYSVFLCYVFLEAFLLFMFVLLNILFSVRLVYFSCCMYNRNNTYKQIKHISIFETNKKHETQQTYIILQPEPEIYLFLVGSRAGYPVFLFLFKCCFSCKQVHGSTCNMLT